MCTLVTSTSFHADWPFLRKISLKKWHKDKCTFLILMKMKRNHHQNKLFETRKNKFMNGAAAQKLFLCIHIINIIILRFVKWCFVNRRRYFKTFLDVEGRGRGATIYLRGHFILLCTDEKQFL